VDGGGHGEGEVGAVEGGGGGGEAAREALEVGDLAVGRQGEGGELVGRQRREARAILDRIEAGEATLAELESALLGGGRAP
jgi:hypothetical protein